MKERERGREGERERGREREKREKRETERERERERFKKKKKKRKEIKESWKEKLKNQPSEQDHSVFPVLLSFLLTWPVLCAMS